MRLCIWVSILMGLVDRPALISWPTASFCLENLREDSGHVPRQVLTTASSQLHKEETLPYRAYALRGLPSEDRVARLHIYMSLRCNVSSLHLRLPGVSQFTVQQAECKLIKVVAEMVCLQPHRSTISVKRFGI